MSCKEGQCALVHGLRFLSLLSEGCEQTSNFEFFNLIFVKSLMDNESVWLLGAFLRVYMERKTCEQQNSKIGTANLVHYFEIQRQFFVRSPPHILIVLILIIYY